jgi:CBS domain-containing protein
MIKNYNERVIGPGTTLLDAFKKMDILDKKLLIVLENNYFLGLLSAGDFNEQ